MKSVDYYFSDKTWSKLPTAWYTTALAEGLIAATMECTKLYKCEHVDVHIFQLAFKGSSNNKGDLLTEVNDNSEIAIVPIHLFYCIHTVHIDEDGTMH